MVWDQLGINKPHLAYLIIGGFTSLFMLCSLFVKERLYIGEATVATICGVIFGPHAANLFNPLSWGNTDQITLEASRVVLVVQCFAVGVELPKAYMERHWRSVVFLLVPVMTFGWLITSLFIWWMIEPLSWLESLACAACVTATDPVLASSVVGKGKFAKRVPKHLRDLLSAESGCNDGMAFPFIYLSFYIIHYRPNTAAVAQHWFLNTILYECIFGAIYGVLIGYMGRHAIKWADRRGLIDRESFLVFYFVLALFCAGTGATLGTDDLLVGFAAGVGFSNDGWFTQKTEESHVSNVIDLLLNLTYFVYLGAIIPWEQYNNTNIGLTPWRLVVIAIFVIFFRRIPIMMALKPFIPDIKTWREALFAGHFGPIGVGAIFASILARAELETDTTEPLAVVPTDPNSENYALVQIIWPLTTFLVITSILVHGSSIAVFTLGKRINSFTLTMSYTQANEEGPTWMNRLPRIASTARASMSKDNDEGYSATSSTDNLQEWAPGTLPPTGLKGAFLRRQREDDTPMEKLRGSKRRNSKWESGMGPGGPISQSAIAPRRRSDIAVDDSVSDTLIEKSATPTDSEDKEEPPDQLEANDAADKRREAKAKNSANPPEPEIEVFNEGDEMIVEDEEGTVLNTHETKGETDEEKRKQLMDDEAALRKETGGEHAKGKYHPHTRNEEHEVEEAVKSGLEHPENAGRKLLKKFGWDGLKRKGKGEEASGPSKDQKSEPTSPNARTAAHAYQFGHTLIVEDEDGEVIRKIDLSPKSPLKRGASGGIETGHGHVDTMPMRLGLKRMGTWAGLGHKGAEEAEASGESGNPTKSRKMPDDDDDPDDARLRFTVGTGGRRMSKQEFVQQLTQLDPKLRRQMVEDSDAPRDVKDEVHADAIQEGKHLQVDTTPDAHSKKSLEAGGRFPLKEEDEAEEEEPLPLVRRISTTEDKPKGDDNLAYVDSNDDAIPFHNVPKSVKNFSSGQGETAAERRRRLASSGSQNQDSPSSPGRSKVPKDLPPGETAAERRRRLAALGEIDDTVEESDSEDDGQERKPKQGHEPVSEPDSPQVSRGIRFADLPAVSQGRIQWGEDVGKKGKR